MTDTENAAATAERWIQDAAAIRARAQPLGLVDREVMRTQSGLEFLQGWLLGDQPPPMIGSTLDMLMVECELGRVVFQGLPKRDYFNPLGSVHGGFAATLLDSCVGCAVHSMLPAGKGYTTLELKVHYLRAMTDRTGPVRAEGKVISVGNQTGVAEGRITDASGKLLAFATTTCLIFPT